MADLSFEVDPLDINIAKIQFELINNFNSHQPDLPLSSGYESKDPTLKISDLKVLFYQDSKDCEKLTLDVEVWDSKKEKKYIYTLKSGQKKEVFEYLKDKTFLFAIKELVLKIDEVS